MESGKVRFLKVPEAYLWLGMRSRPACAIFGIGILLNLVAVFAVRVAPDGGSRTAGQQLFLEYPNVRDLSVRETAELFDPAPLIVPTKWNYAADLSWVRMRQDEAALLFTPFPAEITLPHGDDYRSINTQTRSVEGPEDLLRRIDGYFFSNFGADEMERNPVPERFGYLEIESIREGRVVRAETVRGAFPRIRDELALWVFNVIVGSAGNVGDALMVHGSGRESTDQMVRDYLKVPQTLAGLRPGYYRVTIGP